MSDRHGVVPPALAALLLLAACEAARQGAASPVELQAVQQAVAEATGREVRDGLHDARHLTVAVVNSPIGSLPSDQRRDRATGIARLAYRAYASRSKLASVTVTLVERRTHLLVFRRSRTESFRFGPAELEGPSDAAQAR